MKFHGTYSCLLLKLSVTKTLDNITVDSLVNGVNIFVTNIVVCIFFTYSCLSAYVGDKVQNLDKDWYGLRVISAFDMFITILVNKFDIFLNR